MGGTGGALECLVRLEVEVHELLVSAGDTFFD